MQEQNKINSFKTREIADNKIDTGKSEVLSYFRKASGSSAGNKDKFSRRNKTAPVFPSDDLALTEVAKKEIDEEFGDPKSYFQHKSTLDVNALKDFLDDEDDSAQDFPDENVPLFEKLQMISRKTERNKSDGSE
jgi:hypothetical protein